MSLHDLHLKSSEKNIPKSFSLADLDKKNEKKEFIIEKTYVIEKLLGEGAFGKVNLARHILTNQHVAIKTLEKSKIIDEKDEKRIAREISILTKLRHPNLIQLLDIIETKNSLHLIMEYANGGELFDYIVKSNRLEEKEACRFYQQLIRGIEYIHSKQIAHRDIKPENILLDSFQNLKLVDFGLGNFCPPNTLLQTACGSPSYAPPEMIDNRKYSGLAADLWSAGVVLYAMVCGYLPFEDEDNVGIYRKILNGEIEYPEWLSDELVDLLKGVLQVDENKRFSLEEIKNHKWLQLEESKSGLYEQLQGVYDKKINEKILNQTVALGFKRDEIIETVEKRKHNRISAVYFLLLLKELKTYHEKINKLSIDNEKGDGRRRTWSNGKSPLLKDSKRITAEWNSRIIEEDVNKNEKIDEEHIKENHHLIEDLVIKKEDESQKMITSNEEIPKNLISIQKDQEAKIFSKNDSKDKLEENSSETTQIKESPSKTSPNFLEFLQSKSGDPNTTIRKLNNEDEYETKEENILTESLKESTHEEKNTSENNTEYHKTDELSTTSPEMVKNTRPSLKINYNIVIHETDNFSPNKAEYEFFTCESQEEIKKNPTIETPKGEEIVSNNDTYYKKIIQEELNNLYCKLAIVTKNENKTNSQEYDSQKVIKEEMNSLYDRTLMKHVELMTEKVSIKEKELIKSDEIDQKSKIIIADELTDLYKKAAQKVCEIETAELNKKEVINQELEKSQTKLILQELDHLMESICTNDGKQDNAKINAIKIKEGVEIEPILKKQKTENLPHKEEKKSDTIRNKSPIIQKKPIRVEKKKKEEHKTSENKPKKDSKQMNNMLIQSAKLSKEEKQQTFEHKSSPLKKTIPRENNAQKAFRSTSKEKQSIEQKPMKEEKKYSNNKKPLVMEKSNPEKKILLKSEKKVELKKIDSKLRKTEKYVLSEINEEKQGSSKKKETSSNDSSKLEMMYDILRKDKLLYKKIEKALKNPAKDSNLNESKLSNSDKMKILNKSNGPKSSIHIKNNSNMSSGSKKLANQSFNLEHPKNSKHKVNLSFSVDNSKFKNAAEKNRKDDFSVDSYKRKEEKRIFELKFKEKLNKFQLEKKNEKDEKEKKSRDQKNTIHKMSSDRNGIKPFKGPIEFKSFSSKTQDKLFSDLVSALRSLNIDNIQENDFSVRFFTKKGVEGKGEVRLMSEYDNLCLISFEMVKGEEKEYNGVCFEILKSMKI